MKEHICVFFTFSEIKCPHNRPFAHKHTNMLKMGTHKGEKKLKWNTLPLQSVLRLILPEESVDFERKRKAGKDKPTDI